MNNLDPTPNKKYLEWIVRKLLVLGSGMNVIGKGEEIHDYLKRFDDLTNRKQIEKNDIRSYNSYEELVKAVLDGEEKSSIR